MHRFLPLSAFCLLLWQCCALASLAMESIIIWCREHRFHSNRPEHRLCWTKVEWAIGRDKRLVTDWDLLRAPRVRLYWMPMHSQITIEHKFMANLLVYSWVKSRYLSNGKSLMHCWQYDCESSRNSRWNTSVKSCLGFWFLILIQSITSIANRFTFVRVSIASLSILKIRYINRFSTGKLFPIVSL